MPIKKIAPQYKHEYKIIGRLSFTNLVYTDSLYPDGHLGGEIDKLVDAARHEFAVLQSAQEAAAFHIELNKKCAVHNWQGTRTAAIYFKKQGKHYVAFDDIPPPEQNIILQNTQAGYYHSSGQEDIWLKWIGNKLIQESLARAKRDRRIIEVPEGGLELSLVKISDSCSFCKSDHVRAILGNLAEDYADLLRRRGRAKVSVKMPDWQTWKQIPSNKVAIWDVVFYDRDGLESDINAQYPLYCSADAHGVRNPLTFSQYNKSKLQIR